MEKLIFTKGEQSAIPGLIIMDDIECLPIDTVRLTHLSNVYECVLEIQANYAKTGKFIIE
jgi:hypothetical protein